MSPVWAALLPALIDVIKSGASRLLFGQRALTVDDEIKLMEAESKKIQALAQLDRPEGNVSTWVSNVRALFRYVAATLIIILTFITIVTPSIPEGYVKYMLDLMSGVIFFLFGHRTWIVLKNKM
jgi:hypothetical protein